MCAGDNHSVVPDDEIRIESPFKLGVGGPAQGSAGTSPCPLIHENNFTSTPHNRGAVVQKCCDGVGADPALLAALLGMVGQ